MLENEEIIRIFQTKIGHRLHRLTWINANVNTYPFKIDNRTELLN